MPWLRSLLITVALTPLALADWPQWLGPNRDGSTTEKVAAWKGPLKVLWRHPLGEGHSSPVVADGLVYIFYKSKDGEAEVIEARDAQTGAQRWLSSSPRAAYKGLFGNGPRATPAVFDGRVYAYGITGVLTCLEARTGKRQWQVDALKQYGAKNLFFGASCSPLVEGDCVLVNVGGKGASVVAFDRATGKEVWRKLDDGATYSSPIVFGEGKARQVVFLTQEGLRAFRPADGEVLWQHPLKDKLSESSTTPVKVGDLLIGSSITFGSLALRLKTEGGKPAVSEVWKKPQLTCYFSTPVAVGKELYLVTGMATLMGAKATLRCIDVQTGKELWNKPGVGKYHASLLRTADNKLLMLEEAGDLVLIEPSAKEYRELARARICGETWAHPALADGRLYVRDGKELLCLELPR